MVCPNAEADKGNTNRCSYHCGIAEDRLSRKHWDNLIRDSKRRHYKDIHFGVAKNPEEVHPDDGRTAGLCIEEMSAEIAIDE